MLNSTSRKKISDVFGDAARLPPEFADVKALGIRESVWHVVAMLRDPLFSTHVVVWAETLDGNPKRWQLDLYKHGVLQERLTFGSSSLKDVHTVAELLVYEVMGVTKDYWIAPKPLNLKEADND